MDSSGRKRPLKLRQASAYFRLAGKAMRAGDLRAEERYRRHAERLVEENRRAQEFARRLRDRTKHF